MAGHIIRIRQVGNAYRFVMGKCFEPLKKKDLDRGK